MDSLLPPLQRRPSRVTTFAISLAIVSFPAATILHAGILGDAANETRDGKPSEESSRHDCDDDDDDGFGSFLFDLVFGTMLECVFGTSEKRLGTDACGRTIVTRWYVIPYRDDVFTPFPYCQDNPGTLVPMDRPHVDSYYFAGRFAFEYGNNFDTLDRFAGSALVEWRTGLGFDASGHSYGEDLPTGGRDHLAIGDVNLLWRMAQTERTQLRLGVGMNWLADSVDTEAGINFTARGDIFPMKPLILTGEFDFGTIGDATTLHGRGSVGVNFGQTEFFVGYDYRSIDDVDLKSPMLGVQFWY